jgi:two-component system, NarL family, response regulator NreC
MGAQGPVPGNGQRLGIFLGIPSFPALVTGYRALLDAQPDMQVVGVLDDQASLRDQVAQSTADVVITECLPYVNTGCVSIAAIETIRAAKPGVRILAVECRCGSDQFSLAIKAGADGFLTREAHPVDVLDAVHRVARGETYVSPAIVTRMVNTYVLRSPDATQEDAYESLSERSREIFRLVAFGHTNREIARTLHLSEQTVHNHRAAIMEKLGFHDRVDLLKYALRRGVIQAAEL